MKIHIRDFFFFLLFVTNHFFFFWFFAEIFTIIALRLLYYETASTWPVYLFPLSLSLSLFEAVCYFLLLCFFIFFRSKHKARDRRSGDHWSYLTTITLMDRMCGFRSTEDYSEKATLMMPSDYQSLICSTTGDNQRLFGSDELATALSSELLPRIRKAEDNFSLSVIKSKIASHPLYPRLLQTYIDCQKVISLLSCFVFSFSCCVWFCAFKVNLIKRQEFYMYSSSYLKIVLLLFFFYSTLTLR